MPYFNGHMQIEDFLDWIGMMERYFSATNVLENQVVRLVAFRLKGSIVVWLDQL